MSGNSASERQTETTDADAAKPENHKAAIPEDTLSDDDEDVNGGERDETGAQSETAAISGAARGGGSSYAAQGDEDSPPDESSLTAVFSLDDLSGEVKTYSAEEYFSYIGFDVSSLKLPEEMTMEIPSQIEMTFGYDGEITGDTAFFTASGGGKRLEIMTSRAESVDWAVDMYKKIGENASEFSDGASATVYAIRDGASFTMNFENFDESERKSIVGQITGG